MENKESNKAEAGKRDWITFDFKVVPKSTHVYCLFDGETNKVLRIGVTINPYSIAADTPDGVFVAFLRADNRECAELVANRMVSDMNPPRPLRLFNVYTVGQAVWRLRRAHIKMSIEEAIKAYSEETGINQRIFTHKGQKWVSKEVVRYFTGEAF